MKVCNKPNSHYHVATSVRVFMVQEFSDLNTSPVLFCPLCPRDVADKRVDALRERPPLDLPN